MKRTAMMMATMAWLLAPVASVTLGGEKAAVEPAADPAAASWTEVNLMEGLTNGTVPEMTEDDFKPTGWKRSQKDGNVGQHRWAFNYVTPQDGSPAFLDMYVNCWMNGPDWTITRDMWLKNEIKGAKAWEMSGKIRIVGSTDNSVSFGVKDGDGAVIASIVRNTCPVYGADRWNTWVAQFAFNQQSIIDSASTKDGYAGLLAATDKWVAFKIATVTEKDETFLRLTYGEKTVDAPTPDDCDWHAPRMFYVYHGWYDSRKSSGNIQTRDLKLRYVK